MGIRDLSNLRFGRLICIRIHANRIGKDKRVAWECLCDCGNTIVVTTRDLQIKQVQSCGCMRLEMYNNNSKDLTGKRFTKLYVLSLADFKDRHGIKYWVCQCDCGNKINVRGDSLKSGNTKSCGCFKIQKLKELVGNKNPFWNPDLTDQDRKLNADSKRGDEFKKWSHAIKKKFNFTCQICYVKGKKMVSHHINSWATHPDLRYNMENGICLCEKCHKEFHKKYGRKTATSTNLTEFIRDKQA